MVGQQVGTNAVDYVVTPIVEAGGVLVPIVRGYVPAGAPLPDPPTGPVTVTGALQESQYYSGTGATIAAVSTDNLVSRWNTRLRDGYVVLRTSTPSQPGITVLPATAVHVHHGLPVWRNITYAAQWLIFAGFVAFFWFRASRDHVRATQGAPSEPVTNDSEPTRETP
jgi:cytochrome oxidase assembly protein ShyY1